METPNLHYLDDLAGTDLAFRKEILDILRYELKTERLAYTQALQREDWTNTGNSVHKLKHKIGILGMENGYRLAIRYEEGLRQADSSLSGEFEKVLNKLDAYLQSNCL